MNRLPSPLARFAAAAAVLALTLAAAYPPGPSAFPPGPSVSALSTLSAQG